MFSTNSGSDFMLYDFESEENAPKWKKLFTSSLQKVLSQVHPKMIAKEDALEYVESLILRLLAMLCASPSPHTVQDVEDRVLRTFPNPIDQWAIGDAQAAIEKGRKKTNLVLPVDRVHSQLRDTLQIKIDYQVTSYIVAVLEYISADILKLAGSYVKNIKDFEVSQQDIRVAMCADKVLMDMFHQDDGNDDPLLGPLVEEPSALVDGSFTYEDLVKDLIIEEKAYIRELHMIGKVFRDKLYEISALQGPDEKRQLDYIFSNIHEIYEFSVNLLGSLEDTLEVTKEEELPAIGTCFEELAEGAEFDVYAKYGGDVLRSECRETLLSLVDQPDVSLALTIVRHGFKEAVKYYLPRLLLVPVNHVFSYFKYIEFLLNVADNEETKESLEQVKGLLWPLQSQLDRSIQTSPYNAYLKRKLGEISSKHGRSSRQATLQKLNEIQKSIEGWEGKDIAQCCSEFIMEGSLKFGLIGKKQSDRHVFLFDGLIVLCKCKMNEYKFKEKFLMRVVEIVDRNDSDGPMKEGIYGFTWDPNHESLHNLNAEDGLSSNYFPDQCRLPSLINGKRCYNIGDDVAQIRHSFEIRPRDQPSVVLSAKSAEEKNNWMAALVRINTQSMLERILDSILLHEETKHPLRLPDPSIYPFSVQDSEENIIIEERENSGTPIIRGAALFKLVERLTYHMYADPMFVRTFLTTYRSFCTPMELLDLLIQRFDIPEPEPPDISEEDPPDIKAQKQSAQRESLKRFRKEYSQPVQFRVLNVLRHWVDYHFYDFESDKALLEKLTTFLDGVKGKSMKKWVDSITKIILRKCNEEPREITFSHNKSPPSPKVHLHMEERDWEVSLPVEIGNTTSESDQVRPLLMLHPIEIARQLTLLDFDLYRAVKPSELVGTHWTKEDKERRSPNLLKMIHHTNGVSNWLQKCVVDCDNFEERVAVLNRIIEILVMLYDLNNFSGVFQVSGTLESAAVHRLELTKAEVKRRLPPYQLKIYDEALELGKNHYKKYLEKLRSINPPCVPFFGMYLTNILHIEEGNPDFLPRAAKGLVNFNKRRKVADITGEIQQYQNQPYCLEVDTKIRHFLETLPPFAGFTTEHEVSNYLYNRSKDIEPKNCKKPLVRERRWVNIPLKSPGIKPRSGRSVPNPLPSMFGSGHKPTEGGPDGEETPHHLTPPTPSTPGTPPPSANPADNSIFATVEIGSGALLFGRHDYRGSISGSSSNHTLQHASVPPTPISSNPPLPPPPHTPLSVSALPPPLPPRRRREPSLGDTSPKVKQAPDAPQLPPRDASPPPIPPRAATSTLPRMHSSSALSHHPPPPPLHNPSGSLASIPSSISGVTSSLHHAHLQSSHAHHNIPPHHHAPFCGAPPHLQYHLDPPPQRRRTCSMDLTSPGSNGPHAGVISSGIDTPPSESPPPPPPRLAPRLPAAFTYDHHNL